MNEPQTPPAPSEHSDSGNPVAPAALQRQQQQAQFNAAMGSLHELAKSLPPGMFVEVLCEAMALCTRNSTERKALTELYRAHCEHVRLRREQMATRRRILGTEVKAP